MAVYVTENSLAQKTESWLASIAPYNRRDLRLIADKAALLVVDMQNYFLHESGHAFLGGGKAVVPTVGRVIDGFREAGRPILYTRHVHNPDGSDAGIMGWWWRDMIVEGTTDSEILESLAPRPEDRVICKHRYSAFYETDLDSELRNRGIEDIVIAGVMTNLCCESTARDGFYRDYRMFVLADGTGTVTEEMHLASLMNLAYGFAQVSAAGEIISQLTGRR